MGLGFGRSRSTPPQRVILDLDMGSDNDDVLDLICAARFHIWQEIQIIAAGSCTSVDKGAGVIDATLTHYGLTIPIGTWKGASFSPNGDQYCASVYDNCPHPNIDLAASCADALEVYDAAILAAPNATVDLITTGPLNQVEAFRVAHPTTFARLARVIVVAGNPGSTAEFNVVSDKAAANSFAANCPVELVVCQIPLGTEIDTIGGSLAAGCPGKRANDAAYGPRPAWTPPAIELSAGHAAYYTLTAGTWAVDADDGTDTFTENAGPHKLMTLVDLASTYRTRFDAYLNEHAG